jgi:hypothetical protein
MNTTPEARLAAALDAVAPGADDLEDHPTDSPGPDRIDEVREALMDVMLGVRMTADGTRSASGINHYIRHQIPVPIVRLVAWQDRLRQALEKL